MAVVNPLDLATFNVSQLELRMNKGGKNLIGEVLILHANYKQKLIDLNIDEIEILDVDYGSDIDQDIEDSIALELQNENEVESE